MAMDWVTQSGYLSNNKLNLDFQKAAQPLLRFRQFVNFKESFGKQQGQTVNWLKVANVGTVGGDVAETNTMNETTQSLGWGTLTVGEMGNSIPFSFKIESLSEFDIKEIIRGGLLDDAVKCLDGKVEREMNKTPLRYAGLTTTTGTVTTNSVATATNTSVLNSYHIRKMRLELEKRNVPTWEGGDYVIVASLEAAESLEGAMEAVNQYTESGYTKILSGEVGKVHGVRCVKDAFASRFTYDSAARTATAKSWAQSQSLEAYMFGRPTVREAVAVPEEIRLKVVTDYGRSKGLAWYFLGGWSIERADEGNARIIKWDSAA
jgi:N4-gp56 family major capsid protein